MNLRSICEGEIRGLTNEQNVRGKRGNMKAVQARLSSEMTSAPGIDLGCKSRVV